MRLIDADAANIYLNSTGVEMIKDMPGIDLPDGYDLEQVKELVEADKEGRCLVLPCNVGDVLYVLTTDSLTGIEETECTGIRIRSKNNAVIKAPCTYDDWGSAWREFTLRDFGKKVFLSKEEAEKVLEGLE